MEKTKNEGLIIFMEPQSLCVWTSTLGKVLIRRPDVSNWNKLHLGDWLRFVAVKKNLHIRGVNFVGTKVKQIATKIAYQTFADGDFEQFRLVGCSALVTGVQQIYDRYVAYAWNEKIGRILIHERNTPRNVFERLEPLKWVKMDAFYYERYDNSDIVWHSTNNIQVSESVFDPSQLSPVRACIGAVVEVHSGWARLYSDKYGSIFLSYKDYYKSCGSAIGFGQELFRNSNLSVFIIPNNPDARGAKGCLWKVIHAQPYFQENPTNCGDGAYPPIGIEREKITDIESGLETASYGSTDTVYTYTNENTNKHFASTGSQTKVPLEVLLTNKVLSSEKLFDLVWQKHRKQIQLIRKIYKKGAQVDFSQGHTEIWVLSDSHATISTQQGVPNTVTELCNNLLADDEFVELLMKMDKKFTVLLLKEF